MGKCPICGRTVGIYTNDPLLVIPSLSTDEFKGFIQLITTHIEELQDERHQQEIDNGVTPLTNFTPISILYFYQNIKQYILELRSSTEKILTITGMSLHDFLSTDEDGNSMNSKDNWTDLELTEKYQCKAIHIEDLRHFISMGWKETWIEKYSSPYKSVYLKYDNLNWGYWEPPKSDTATGTFMCNYLWKYNDVDFKKRMLQATAACPFGIGNVEASGNYSLSKFNYTAYSYAEPTGWAANPWARVYFDFICDFDLIFATKPNTELTINNLLFNFIRTNGSKNLYPNFELPYFQISIGGKKYRFGRPGEPPSYDIYISDTFDGSFARNLYNDGVQLINSIAFQCDFESLGQSASYPLEGDIPFNYFQSTLVNISMGIITISNHD
jgi:hypothetical protein